MTARTVGFVVNRCSIPQSLAKLTVNFQSSLCIGDSAGEVVNSTGTVGDSCNLQQYCDTGCQTDIMGEVRHLLLLRLPLKVTFRGVKGGDDAAQKRHVFICLDHTRCHLYFW